MENTNMPLQNFTDYESKKTHLLGLEVITKEDFEILDSEEKGLFIKILIDKVNILKGDQREDLLEKIEPITPQSLKNQLWESNHLEITYAISTLMQEYGRMPSKNEIALETKLSRQTVHKHIKEFSSHSLYKFELQQFKFASSKVLAKLFKYAVNGDVKACKVYLDMVGFKNDSIDSGITSNTQNNFIQINNTILNQENLSKLNQSQIIEIENILKLALPENK